MSTSSTTQRTNTDPFAKYDFEERKVPAQRPATPFPNMGIVGRHAAPNPSPTSSLDGKLQILVPQAALEDLNAEDALSFNSCDSSPPSSSSPLKRLPLRKAEETATSRLVNRIAKAILDPDCASDALSTLNAQELRVVKNNLTILLNLFPLVDLEEYS